MSVHYQLVTAPAPGAIAIVQVFGDGVAAVIEKLTGVQPTRRAALAQFEDIDEGLVVALHDDWCQLMPHGGPRVVQRLCERLSELGANPVEQVDARTRYPEAASEFEADMLATLAQAASPAACDLLLAQPQRWRDAIASGAIDAAQVLGDSRVLDHLVTPPSVVLVGRANVGKSTLTNLVVGRAASITADLPGTTRDWVAALAELPTPMGELAVRWHDTPGLRRSPDAIEQRAIGLARAVIGGAEVLIAIRDGERDWPSGDDLPRPADLAVWNKVDLKEPDEGAAHPAKRPLLTTCATDGVGLEPLGAAVAGVLGFDEPPPGPLWAFSDRLKQLTAGADLQGLARYQGG